MRVRLIDSRQGEREIKKEVWYPCLSDANRALVKFHWESFEEKTSKVSKAMSTRFGSVENVTRLTSRW
jgi:hypothetical protein